IKLSKINMPQSLKKILGGVFSQTGLKNLSIPANVFYFEPSGWNTNLESIEVDPKNKNYTSIDGVVYDKNIKTLINVPVGLKKKSLKVPNSVERVIAWSVAGINPPWNSSASKLKTIHIPKNAIIEESALAGSENIEVVRY
ncbi:MAG: leucine-rich repeat protein, partial [Spartobacteria bacterium]